MAGLGTDRPSVRDAHRPRSLQGIQPFLVTLVGRKVTGRLPSGASHAAGVEGGQTVPRGCSWLWPASCMPPGILSPADALWAVVQTGLGCTSHSAPRASSSPGTCRGTPGLDHTHHTHHCAALLAQSITSPYRQGLSGWTGPSALAIPTESCPKALCDTGAQRSFPLEPRRAHFLQSQFLPRDHNPSRPC